MTHTSVLSHFAALCNTRTHRVMSSTSCPCVWGADWCLQSDGVPDSRSSDLTADDSFINTEVCKMTHLARLELDYNNLEAGPINECLCNLTNLTQLRLAHTNRNGSIPTCIGKLTRMQNLSFGYNNLVGELPISLCNLRQLEALYVEENTGITGRLPHCLGNLTSLKQLDLMNLQLHGPMPPEIFTLPQLEYLLMSNADLYGICDNMLWHHLSRISQLWLCCDCAVAVLWLYCDCAVTVLPLGVYANPFGIF